MQVGQITHYALNGGMQTAGGRICDLIFAKEVHKGRLLHATVLQQPKFALELLKSLIAGFIQRAITPQGSLCCVSEVFAS